MFDFGAHLKFLRQTKGITQKQLGQEIGTSERGIQNYEMGVRKPTYDILIALADFFDCSIDYLVGRSDTPYMLKDENVELLSPEELELVRKFRERNR